MKLILLFLMITILFISCGKEKVKAPAIAPQVKTLLPDGDQCFQDLKKKAISKEIEITDEATDIDDEFYREYSELMIQAPVKHEYFLLDHQTHSEIQKVSRYKKGKTLIYSFKKSDNSYFVNIELISKQIDHYFSFNKNYKILSDCKLKYIEMDKVLAHYETKQNSVLIQKHNRLNEKKEERYLVNQKLLDFNLEAKDFKTKSSETIQGLCPEDMELENCSMTITYMQNGLYELKEVFPQYTVIREVKIENNAITQLQIMKPIKMSFEAIDIKNYLNIKFQKDDATQVGQFADDFFEVLGSKLKVETSFIGNMDLLKNYFLVKTNDSDNYYLSIKPTLNTVETPLTTEILPEEIPYTKPSFYIDVNHQEIQKIKKRILAKKPKTREEAIHLVQSEVTSLLDYDYEMVENDLVDILKLDDFLSKGKGVCQHFALLSTTILRALGIPARIISGYYLKSGTFNGHAWTEAKLKNRWLPFEPQSDGIAEIRVLNYFPLAEMIFYEKGNPSLQRNDQYFEAFSSSFYFSDSSE